jgi:hypothetical protein
MSIDPGCLWCRGIHPILTQQVGCNIRIVVARRVRCPPRAKFVRILLRALEEALWQFASFDLGHFPVRTEATDGKTIFLPWDSDRIPQMDTETVRRPAPTCSTATSPGTQRGEDPRLRCLALPPSGGSHCWIPARSQLSDISVICLVIPEILMLYDLSIYATSPVWVDFLWIFQDDNRTFQR